MLTESQVLDLEERLRQAMLTSNVAELDALIAPELLFTTHLGSLLTKADDLEIHRSGIFKLSQLHPSEQRIQRHEGCAIVSVNMHLLGHYAETAIDAHIRYTRVWAKSSSGTVQIIAGHASAIASA